jgi:putative glutamine amidotransferase
VELGLGLALLRSIADSCDGVLLPGSPADVDPALYGEAADPASAAPDRAREQADFFLLDDAAARRKPVLAICFGLQSLNIWRGGSLVQDLLPLPVNHAAGAQVAVAHTALVAPSSLLASLVKPAEAPQASGVASGAAEFLRLPVNSSHHQAVASPGQGLRIVARSAEDGVIEALEAEGEASSSPLLLGVQWHPERSFDHSATSRALFSRLVSDASRFAAQREASLAR